MTNRAGPRCRQNKANLRQTRRETPESLPPPSGPVLSRAGCTNKPNSGRYADQEIGVPRRQSCETKPIGRRGAVSRDIPLFQYSIIPPFQSCAVRAKQSQFPPSTDAGQVLCGKRVMTNPASNEPWKNKANFRGKGSGAKGQRSAGLPVPPLGPVVQTKPISDGGARTTLGRQRPNRYSAGVKRAKQDAHDKSPRIGLRSAFLSEYRGSVRLIPTFVGRVKQSQFPGSACLRKTVAWASCP